MEQRDIPAFIRLYIRSQLAFYGRPGKDGKPGKGYWEDNQTISDNLGVKITAVQNALRDSDIERMGGGMGRGQDKRFRIVKKPWNHGDRRDKDKKSSQDSQGIQSPLVHVESTCTPRRNNVSQQSNLRVPHVESTHATGIEGEGIEEKGIEGEGGGSTRARTREKKSPPPASDCSFTIHNRKEALEFLKPFDLLKPDGLAQGYYDLIASVLGCYHSAVDDLDITSADLFLNGLPPEYRRPEVLADWIYWRASQLPRKWNKKTHFFTKFEDTWETFRPQADAMLKDLRKVDEERRQAEVRLQKEQEEAERMRQEAQDALWTAEEERLEQEAKSRRLALHNAFVASLPSTNSVIAAVKAIPNPETLWRKDYVAWLDALLKATGFLLELKPDSHDWAYIRNAYNAVGLNPNRFIERTREYAIAKAVTILDRLKADETIHKPTRIKLRWDNYPEFFGVDLFHPEACCLEIPNHLFDYRSASPPDEAEGGVPTLKTDKSGL